MRPALLCVVHSLGLVLQTSRKRKTGPYTARLPEADTKQTRALWMSARPNHFEHHTHLERLGIDDCNPSSLAPWTILRTRSALVEHPS